MIRKYCILVHEGNGGALNGAFSFYQNDAAKLAIFIRCSNTFLRVEANIYAAMWR